MELLLAADDDDDVRPNACMSILRTSFSRSMECMSSSAALLISNAFGR